MSGWILWELSSYEDCFLQEYLQELSTPEFGHVSETGV